MRIVAVLVAIGAWAEWRQIKKAQRYKAMHSNPNVEWDKLKPDLVGLQGIPTDIAFSSDSSLIKGNIESGNVWGHSREISPATAVWRLDDWKMLRYWDRRTFSDVDLSSDKVMLSFNRDASQPLPRKGFLASLDVDPDKGLWLWCQGRHVHFTSIGQDAKWAVSSQGDVLVQAMETWSKANLDGKWAQRLGSQVEAFDIATKRRLWLHSGPYRIKSFRFVAKDRLILADCVSAIDSRSYAALWNARTGKFLGAWKCISYGAEISPDGRTLAVPAINGIKLWDIADITHFAP